MDREAASGLGLDVEGEFEFLILQGELQAGEFCSQGAGDVCLDLSLEFLTRGGLQWRECGVASVGNEPAFRFGLNAIGKMRDQALQFHAPKL